MLPGYHWFKSLAYDGCPVNFIIQAAIMEYCTVQMYSILQYSLQQSVCKSEIQWTFGTDFCQDILQIHHETAIEQRAV